MAKTQKKSKKLDVQGVLETLNRDVFVVGIGKNITLEEASLRQLIVKAVKDLNFNAVKQLLEVFEECGALPAPPKRGGLIVIPKTWDFDATLKKYDGKPPKDFKPVLSKFGERKLAERETDKAQMLTVWERLRDARGSAVAQIAEIAEPFLGLWNSCSSHKEFLEKFGKLDLAEKKARFEARCKMDKITIGLKPLLDEYDKAAARHNAKWGTKLPLTTDGKGSEKTQFKKGKSGNPKGRPKKLKDRKSIVQKLANEEIAVTENGRSTKKRAVEVVFETLVRLSLTGNPRAAKLHATYLKKYDPPDSEVGFLIVPEQVTVDEYMEGLEEHRIKCIKAMEKAEEEERSIPRIGRTTA